jgi:hypothetical protein
MNDYKERISRSCVYTIGLTCTFVNQNLHDQQNSLNCEVKMSVCLLGYCALKSGQFLPDLTAKYP